MTRRRARRTPDEDVSGSLDDLVIETVRGVRMHQAQVDFAIHLQRHMLPGRVADPPHMEIGVRYVPASDGLNVGGDWFDVFPTGDGCYALSIGDVEGHDMQAATFMGQVRVCLRAITSLVPDPGRVLEHGNDLLLSTDYGRFATCTLFHFHPDTRVLRGACAGHPPSLWITRDRTETLPRESGMPLGVLPGQQYPVTRRDLTESGTLVLLTDGVVEGPEMDMDQGVARVVQAVRDAEAHGPERLAADILDVARFTGHHDDAATLVARYAA